MAVLEKRDIKEDWLVANVLSHFSILDLRQKRFKEALERAHRSIAIRKEISRIEARLAKDFPEYAELANPRPLSIGEVQVSLEGDEALLTWSFGEMQNNLILVKRASVEFMKLPGNSENIAVLVNQLRAALDPSDTGSFKPFQAKASFRNTVCIWAPL